MTPQQKQLFWDYEDLQKEIKELEERRDALKPKILELVTVDQEVPVIDGTIRIESRKKWKFSETVAALEDTLDAKKEEEKQLGVATYEDGEPFVKYYANKKY